MVHDPVENLVANSEKNNGSTRDLTHSLTSCDSQAIENERIRLFTEKKAAETIPFKYEQKYDSETERVFLRYADTDNNSTVDNQVRIGGTLCAAFGTASYEYTNIMASSTLNAQFVNATNTAEKATATIEALVAMKPNDIIEGQLCSRLVILTDQYNEYMRRAAVHNQPLEVIERYLNCATKLMRVYNETLETLNKYRRKGEQKVTVQHVNINGGQAIVTGNMQQGGGDTQKGKEVPHVS